MLEGVLHLRRITAVDMNVRQNGVLKEFRKGFALHVLDQGRLVVIDLHRRELVRVTTHEEAVIGDAWPPGEGYPPQGVVGGTGLIEL